MAHCALCTVGGEADQKGPKYVDFIFEEPLIFILILSNSVYILKVLSSLIKYATLKIVLRLIKVGIRRN